MTKNIKVAGDTSTEKVEVKRRRYNTKGPTVETISMTIPKTLNQTINGIVTGKQTLCLKHRLKRKQSDRLNLPLN